MKRNRLFSWLRSNLLLLVTFSGVVLGVATGLALRPLDLDHHSVHYIAYPGELFMRLLQLMILPLVIASLITGSASLNARTNGRIALRTLLLFLATSLSSSLLGLGLVLAVHPGDRATKGVLGDGDTAQRRVEMADSFLDLGRNLLPDNIFKAAFQTAHTQYIEKANSSDYSREVSYRSGTNTLGIIFFCLAFGTVLGSLGKRAQAVVDFFVVIDEVIMRMVYGIMWVSPLGIGSIICAKILGVANLAQVMSSLGMFIVTAVSGVFIHQFVVLQLMYFVFVRKNPFRFWWGCFQAWMTAFATASTAVALPVTFRCMKDNNHVDPRISKFVLPIGATVNMDGTALFITVASVFVAQMNDIDLDAGKLVTVVLTSTAASIAAASVPSAALVLMLIVLTAIDAPYQDVSLLWAVDWFVDRCRTTNNLLGDCYCAAVVEALSKDDLALMDKEKEILDKLDKEKEHLEQRFADLDAKTARSTHEDDRELNSDDNLLSDCGSSNGDAVMVSKVSSVDEQMWSVECENRNRL